MKVLLVHDYATPRGGAEFTLLGLRDGLRQRGHEVQLFASSAGIADGGGMADVHCFGTTSRFRTLVQTANPSAFWRLRRVLERFQPDVVHVKMFLTQMSPLILPLLRNVPSLYHVIWYRPVCPLGTKLLPDGTICEVPSGPACYHNRCLPVHDWLPLMLQMKLWRHWRDVFGLIVANSEAVKRRLLAEGIAPVEVVPNGVPVRSARLPLAPAPTVAFAGRLVREKGLDVLLDAFMRVSAAMPEARLLVAGDGPEHQHLTMLTGKLGLSSRVSFLGHLSRAEMEQLFEPAWVQAIPSLWPEPFGNVAAEAMMRGTAVVATREGGLGEIVRDGETGLLVPSGDAERLCGALLALLQNRARAEEMGKRGRTVALGQFTEAHHVDRFLGLYQALQQDTATPSGSFAAGRGH